MLEPLIGEHPALRKIKHVLPVLATLNEPLLIIGEPGVGKSLVAAHIHARSPFAHHPIITVDCSLLDHRDQRLRLFGGSIGDSNTSRRSPLQQQTTVVIKSPEYLFTELQEKLLRTLTSRVLTRFNSVRKHPVRCRVLFVIDSTKMRTHRMSQDLSLFLSHCRRIDLPPLRKREQDLQLLARHFARQYIGRKVLGFSAACTPHASLVRLLHRHRWNNNVAELKAFIGNLVVRTPAEVLHDKQALHARQLIDSIRERKPASLRDYLRLVHTLAVESALVETQGNRARAAQLLGLTEAALR